MNKEERTELVFETISKIVGFKIMPNKDFCMIGDYIRGVYKIGEDLNLYYKTNIGTYNMSDYSISQIFKGVYQLEKIEEPLLTDEGKEFLRHFEFEALAISSTNLLYIYGKNKSPMATLDLDIVNLSFDGLKEGKRYSREELGL